MNTTKTGQPHVSSYYAATRNRDLNYPALTEDLETDVCVIGGGFSGVATALSLAERGVDVVLLDANKIGWGASGRNGGQVLAGWSGESAMISQLGDPARRLFERTRYRGHEIIESRIERYDIDCDYVHGTLTVALSNKQMRALTNEVKDQERAGAGDHLSVLNRAALQTHIGSDMYCGGVIDRRGAHCHPLNLCLGEADAASSLGVRIFEDSIVESIEYGPQNRVRTAKNTVVAKSVVLAGNAYHTLCQKRFGGYMFPAKTYIIATEPLSETLSASLLPTNMAVCDANWVLNYFRLSADRRLVFGGRATYSNRRIADSRRTLAPEMRKIFPQLEGIKIDYHWGGTLGVPINRIPMLGRLNDTVFFVQGYSGHGVNCSHIAGEILAEAVLGNTQDVDLFDRVRHVHIPAADVIGGPLFALGMSFYRFRDLVKL